MHLRLPYLCAFYMPLYMSIKGVNMHFGSEATLYIFYHAICFDWLQCDT